MTKSIIKKITLVFALGFVSYANVCRTQEKNEKAFLYYSVFSEPEALQYYEAERFVRNFSQNCDSFPYETSGRLVVPSYTFNQGTLMSYEKYTVQLYKIKIGRITPPYYLLRIFRCNTLRFSIGEDLWLRVSGYQKSDLKVFFDALRKIGYKKKDIYEMVNMWCESDKMFQEIDWDCLLRGYFKNNTQSDCYVSGAYLMRAICYSDWELDIHAEFSKIPMAGVLPEK